MSKKKYTVKEVADILYESSEEEDFSPSESSYKPSSNSGNSKADGDNTYEGESDAFYSESDEEYAADDINSSVDDVTTNLSGTLGERVVLKLAGTIRDNDVAVAFDRFFTSITLMKSIPFPAIGTYMRNRKETPEFGSRLERGQSQFQINCDGLLATRWMDSKEVLVVSNCHKPSIGEVDRKQKDGKKKKVACPLAIVDYNRLMGGVDLADQKAAVYDINRKSQKWWKKVFFKILMLSTVNAWIVHNDLNRKKSTLIQFIVPLAESLIAEGTKHKELKTRRTGGRPSKRPRTELLNIGDHLPLKGSSRRRCVRCTSLQKETRTNYVCSGCNNALCFKCFASYHK